MLADMVFSKLCYSLRLPLVFLTGYGRYTDKLVFDTFNSEVEV